MTHTPHRTEDEQIAIDATSSACASYATVMSDIAASANDDPNPDNHQF